MFAKLNHLAITSDHYTLLGMFYRAVFGPVSYTHLTLPTIYSV